MSIMTAVGETIKRYGCSVAIATGEKEVKTKAFVEPLRYKNKVYVGGQYHYLGYKQSEKYLYIGSPEYSLSENATVIEMHNQKYIVKRCETYYADDRPVYVWAILLPYGTALEDDYESDRETD